MRKRFQLEQLVLAVFEYLDSFMDVSNSLCFANIAHNLGCAQLKSKVMNLITQNFQEVQHKAHSCLWNSTGLRILSKNTRNIKFGVRWMCFTQLSKSNSDGCTTIRASHSCSVLTSCVICSELTRLYLSTPI